MKTKTEVMAKLRQSIAKKKVWLEKSDEELSRIYAERHGTSIVAQKPSKTGMDRAIEDIKQGRVFEANSVEDLISQCNTDTL